MDEWAGSLSGSVAMSHLPGRCGLPCPGENSTSAPSLPSRVRVPSLGRCVLSFSSCKGRSSPQPQVKQISRQSVSLQSVSGAPSSTYSKPFATSGSPTCPRGGTACGRPSPGPKAEDGEPPRKLWCISGARVDDQQQSSLPETGCSPCDGGCTIQYFNRRQHNYSLIQLMNPDKSHCNTSSLHCSWCWALGMEQ